MRKAAITILALMVLMLGCLPPAVAAENDGAISLDRAIEMAAAKDNMLKMAAKEMLVAEARRDTAGKNTTFIPENPVFNLEAEAAYLEYKNAEIGLQKSRKSYETARQALVLNVSNAYWNVIACEENLKALQKLQQKELLKLQIARAGLQVGTASAAELIMAESKLKQAQINVDNAQKALEQAYTKLNTLLGLRTGARPVLTDSPVFEPLGEVNLEIEVQRAKELSPAVWEAIQKIALTERAEHVNLLKSMGTYLSSDARANIVEQAALSAEDVKEQTAQKVRDLYYRIQTLEENYLNGQESIKQLQEALRIAALKYELGMATRAELIEAEANLAQAENGLLNTIYQHAVAKLQFKTPWLS